MPKGKVAKTEPEKDKAVKTALEKEKVVETKLKKDEAVKTEPEKNNIAEAEPEKEKVVVVEQREEAVVMEERANENVRIHNIGIDVGNSFIKSSKKIKSSDEYFKIASKLKIGHDNVNENIKTVKVYINGKKYTVGLGEPLNLETKFFTNSYKIMLLCAIAKSIDESSIVCNLTIGVPISIFNDKKRVREINDHITNYGTNKIEVDGIKKDVTIKNVHIWVEGGILFYNPKKYSKGNVLVVDIGGQTLDVLKIVDGKLDENFSVQQGINKLSSDMLKYINDEYKSDLTSANDILDCYVNAKEYSLNGKKIGFSIVDEYVDIYANGILSRIKQSMSISDSMLVFVGGGAEIIKKSLDKFSETYSIERLESAEFINAFTYENVTNIKEGVK